MKPPILRALLVDDNPDDRELVRRVLAGLPEFRVKVDEASNVRDAEEQLEEHEYALIIADHYMRPGTGTQLLAVAAQTCPRAKRVLMTGQADLGLVTEAIRAGRVDGVFRKDHPEEARSVVRASLAAFKDSAIG